MPSILRPTCFSLLIAMACLATTEPASAQIIQFVDQTATRFPVPNPLEYTNQLTLGDIDGDLDFDIIWANGGNFSSEGPDQLARIYINNGMGTFTDESVARGAVSGNFRGVELGDIDGDLDLDMILAQDFNHLPQLLVNNGLGVFTNQTATRLPNINLSSTRGTFADVDNDGDMDLYLTHGGATNRFGTGQGKLYLNNGLGFFTDVTAARMPNQTVSEPQDCIFADIDADYDLDLRIGSTASAQSKLYKNNGSGFFTDANTNCPNDNNCYSYDFGDVDGDGDMDLLGANANPTTANAELLLINNGLGVFTNASTNISPNPGEDDNDSKFFDFDNDGDMDLIIARLGGTAEKIYRNNGGGMFVAVTGLITPISDSSLDVKVGDVNDDGRLDIITAQGESGSFANRIYINNGAVDTRVPRIIQFQDLPDTTNTVGPYVVRAEVLDDMSSDRNFFYENMRVRYTVNGGPIQFVDMTHSGGQVYRGLIPGQPCGTISYHIRCRDAAGNITSAAPGDHTFAILRTLGDIDGDADVDPTDVGLFVSVLIGEDMIQAHVNAADVNCNGAADAEDIQPFLDAAL